MSIHLTLVTRAAYAALLVDVRDRNEILAIDHMSDTPEGEDFADALDHLQNEPVAFPAVIEIKSSNALRAIEILLADAKDRDEPIAAVITDTEAA